MVRRRERLGDPDRRRRRRPRPARRPRGRRRSTTCIENEVAPRFYDVDADGRARRAGSRWSGTRCKSLGPKVLASPDGARLRARALRARRPSTARALNADYAGAPRAGRLEAAGARGLARRPRRPRRGRAASATRPRSATHAGRARLRLARRRSRPTTSTCRSCTAGSTHDDDLRRHRPRVADARGGLRGRPLPLRRRPSASTTPAPSATPSACIPQERPARLDRRARGRRAAVVAAPSLPVRRERNGALAATVRA